jgi:hypothetical protein
MLKPGDRVVRVGRDHPMSKRVIVGTFGTVDRVVANGYVVRWDTGDITGSSYDNTQSYFVSNNYDAKGLLDKEW